jgi:hypothetical protein
MSCPSNSSQIDIWSLEIPGRENELEEWCERLEGLAPYDGNVYPPEYYDDLSRLDFGGRFLVRLEGDLFYIIVDDHGWERYACALDDDDAISRGSNRLCVSAVNITRREFILDRDIDERDETDRVKGIATSVGDALRDKDKYPTGNWRDVLEIVKDDWNALSDR